MNIQTITTRVKMFFINANYNIIHKMTREHIFVQTMLKLADKNSI